MPSAVTEHRVQIERIIRRGKDNLEAEFNAGPWFCCRAMIWHKAKIYGIQSRATMMSVEQTSTVMIALQMASEWVAGELLESGLQL